jgi:hypothetical protein
MFRRKQKYFVGVSGKFFKLTPGTTLIVVWDTSTEVWNLSTVVWDI